MLLNRTHLSAHEIAMLALDGLPETKRGVQMLADRQGWSWIPRGGRGGGRLYAVVDLPEPAQRDYADRWAGLPSSRPAARVGRPKGRNFFTRNPEVAAAIEVILAERSLSSPRVLELLATHFVQLPSLRTLKRFIASLEADKPALLASTRDPDAFKNNFRMALGRADAAITHANQVWEIDTTVADVTTRGGRRAILGIVDVYSRRPKYLLVPSESAQSVRRTLVETIRAWGVMPERLRTDNGSGYINRTILTAAPLLGIEVEPCLPGSPEKKPFVERLFGTFTRERAELLKGFSGHNVAQAQKLRAAEKKRTGRAVIVPEMTDEELQDVIDNWIEGVYNLRVHSGTGMAPIARFNATPRPSRPAPDDATLKLALSAFVGNVTVGKRGVQWKKGRYWAPELAAWLGRRVAVRRDEDDLGAVFVFDADGRYIATAINHERSGMSEQQFALAAQRHVSEHLARQKAELREAKREFSFEKARDALLRQDAERAGKLVSLPPRTVEHSTPMLESVAGMAAPAPVEMLPGMAADAGASPIAGMTFREKVAWADRLIADADAGLAVDPGELAAARIFTRGAEYRADKIIKTSFAPRASAPAAPTPKAASTETR